MAEKSKSNPDVRAVIDTNVFVPAIAGFDPEAKFYNGAIHIRWKVVVSEAIIEEYQRVILEYGYRADVIIHELNKLYAMDRCRFSELDFRVVSEDLAPRKDRHIIAPCVEGCANVVVTHDRGIHAKKETVRRETRAEVLTLGEAQAKLADS